MKISTEILARLRSAKHVMVFTGAGVSAESGIPEEPEGGRRVDPPRCSHCGGHNNSDQPEPNDDG